MQIHSTCLVHHPLDRVYLAYRDELPLMVPFIPDIREIVVQSREPFTGGVKILNLWIADRDPPKAVANVIKKEWLQWEDYATWSDEGRYVDWRMVLPAMPDRMRCSGRNTFVRDGLDRTKVIISGDLQIDASSFPGVPAFLARRVGTAIEAFIVDLVTPNLTRMNQSLEEYLDDKLLRAAQANGSS